MLLRANAQFGRWARWRDLFTLALLGKAQSSSAIANVAQGPPGMFLLREAEQWAEVDELRDSARGDPAHCSVQGLQKVTPGGTDAL